MFVPWQAPGRREPARVTAGAFTAAGLPVPEHPAQRNIYQLTRRQGLAWSPSLDAHIRRRGGELLGDGQLILVNIDSPAAADGGPLVNALRWLADRAVEAGGLLDLSATVAVRTPGHPASGHLAGWHLWYRADPARPVHLGPLPRCHAIELRTRGTCPGSPGYPIRAHPGELPVLPHWIAALARPPPAPATPASTGHGGAHAARQAGRAASGACRPPSAANETSCCSGQACGPVNWSPTQTSTRAKPPARSPAQPPRSGWPPRTDSAPSQPPSGQGSSAPGQPISPPDHPATDHPRGAAVKLATARGLERHMPVCRTDANLRPVLENRQVPVVGSRSVAVEILRHTGADAVHGNAVFRGRLDHRRKRLRALDRGDLYPVLPATGEAPGPNAGRS